MLDVALRAVRAGFHLLEVHREGEVRDAAVGERGAACEVRHVLDVRRPHDPLVELRDVGEQAIERDVLLGVRAD
jgi:hypothetical protein